METAALQDQFRRAMRLWPSGVAVVIARHGQEVRGMTASSFTSVSLEPPLILVCINQSAQLWPVLEKAGRFSVNLLAEHQAQVSAHFAGHPVEGYPPLSAEEPLALAGALATLHCRTWAIYPGGTHRIVVGEVEKALLGQGARPLLYWNQGYRSLP